MNRRGGTKGPGTRGGSQKGYVIRAWNSAGEQRTTFQITISPHVARMVPAGTRFRAELVEEGILLRRVVPANTPLPKVPAWVRRST